MKHSYFQGPIDKRDYDALLAEFSLDLDQRKAERGRLPQALKLAVEAWDGQDHPPSSIDTAIILKQLGVDEDTLVAALLTDARLRDDWPEDRVRETFGDAVASLTRQVNWLNTFKECSQADADEETPPHKAETLRRMLLATVDDVRAVLIKLAWRVQRLRGLPGEAEPVRRCIARETLDLYAPLANRLGVAQLKWELEDLSFRHLHPDTYRELARSMDDNRAGREAWIEDFVGRVRSALAEAGIEAEVYGRPKHLYSIWKKMQRKGVSARELADLLAVRVIVQTVPQCYMALGVVHGLWQNLPHEFDDYIAHPKDNGYQSLHTAVIGPGGRVVEIQIRTE
ncbi:MAG: bifunctional (p)ppGpp synthetase/guanosine-3',5'-bis(diphosphate) 3'-pyrophosphohydrolase, partial [Gammaproteobacteria bacterium]